MNAVAHTDSHRDHAVRLTEAERQICVWVGKQRYHCAITNARDPGHGPSSKQHGAHFHVRGAFCEFAASLILNRYWRPTIGQIDQRDVGGIVDVRSTNLAAGRLIIKPDGTGPYMLVVQVDDYEYWSPGWIDADDAKAIYPLITGHGDPAHFVPQSGLRPLDELCGLIVAALGERAAPIPTKPKLTLVEKPKLTAEAKEMTWRASREARADELMSGDPDLTREQAVSLAQMEIDIDIGEL